MNLIQELHREGFPVQIESLTYDTKDRSGQDVKRNALRVQILDVNREVLATSFFPFHKSHDPSNRLVEDCLREHRRAPGLDQIYQRLRSNLGHDPVQFISEYSIDEAYTMCHVALRKYIDGPASVVLWNTIHKLSEASSDILVDVMGSELNSLVEGLEIRKKERPEDPGLTRRRLATALKGSWSLAADKMEEALFAKKYDLSQREIDQETYYIRMFAMGVRSLNDEDWVWGMTSALVEDIPSSPIERQIDSTKPKVDA